MNFSNFKNNRKQKNKERKKERKKLTAKNVCWNESSKRFRTFFLLLLGSENDRYDKQQDRGELHDLEDDTGEKERKRERERERGRRESRPNVLLET